MRKERSDLASYCHLVQELISGSVRRHTFSQSELELLFDLQMSKLRKSSKPEALRRYLRAIQLQSSQFQANQEQTILRFSAFLERECAGRLANTGLRSTLPQTAA